MLVRAVQVRLVDLVREQDEVVFFAEVDELLLRRLVKQRTGRVPVLMMTSTLSVISACWGCSRVASISCSDVDQPEASSRW